jgi:hypothetical protein
LGYIFAGLRVTLACFFRRGSRRRTITSRQKQRYAQERNHNFGSLFHNPFSCQRLKSNALYPVSIPKIAKIVNMPRKRLAFATFSPIKTPLPTGSGVWVISSLAS